jgi:hypothetical protein
MTFYALEEVVSCCKASLKHACPAEGAAVGNDARRSWQWCSPLPVVWADGVAGARFRFAGTRGFARWVHALALRIVALHTARAPGFARWVHALALRIVALHTARAPGFARMRWHCVSSHSTPPGRQVLQGCGSCKVACAARIVAQHTARAPGFARWVHALASAFVALHTATPGFARWVHALALRISSHQHTARAPGFARRVNASHG